jgi:two-component system nitrogen regulation sensor histidine kinase NtrY
MKLSTKYSLFIIFIVIALSLVAYPFLQINPFIFVLIELLIILIIVFAVLIYRSLIKPVKMISSGIENIKDKDFATTLNKVGQRDMDKLIDVYNKMIAQLRHERILHQEQNLFLDKLIEASPSAIIILDFDGKITGINKSAEHLLGEKKETLHSRKLNEVKNSFINELSSINDGESKIIKQSGINVIKAQKAHFMDRGSKHHFIILQELTEEILKAEKKSYDKIIRMMSHEINNSIGAINSILNSFRNYSVQLNGEDVNDFDNAINVAVERNIKLNKFMSNFADVVRIPPPNKQKYSINKLLFDVIALMHPICIEKEIALQFDSSGKEIFVDLDAQQMEQVIVNIVKNSIESIERNGVINFELNNDKSPELIISDNGKGISRDIQSNLFTPFFSTKNSGQGIGLTLIREILINHGFKFSLKTDVEGLTEFKIVF